MGFSERIELMCLTDSLGVTSMESDEAVERRARPLQHTPDLFQTCPSSSIDLHPLQPLP